MINLHGFLEINIHTNVHELTMIVSEINLWIIRRASPDHSMFKKTERMFMNNVG